MEHLPCDPNVKDTGFCPVFNSVGWCFEDTHHEFWPRRNYNTPTEKEFRELDENKVEICRDIHNEIHATTPTPFKPRPDVMRECIRRARRGAA